MEQDNKPPVDQTVPPVVAPPPVEQTIPKTKEEWTALAKDDPEKFTKLTQERFDITFREKKELQEKLRAAEEQKKNYELELEKYRKPPTEPVGDLPLDQRYGPGKYPQTKDEWDAVSYEDPVFFYDLRSHYLRDQEALRNDFQESRVKATTTVIQEHPDMYIPETDAEGKPVVDTNGRPVLKINPETGGPWFDPKSPKGMLWSAIWQEGEAEKKRTGVPNPYHDFKNSPTLLMAEMERRLRMEGKKMVNNAQNNHGILDETSLAPHGVMPPKSGPVRFDSEEERQYAEKAVAQGTYSSLEDYAKWKAVPKNYSYIEKNREPDFTKR